MLSAEHVSGRLGLRQPPFAEQTQSVWHSFDVGHGVLDEELFACVGGRVGTWRGMRKRSMNIPLVEVGSAAATRHQFIFLSSLTEEREPLVALQPAECFTLGDCAEDKRK